jgi:hypothetical protein
MVGHHRVDKRRISTHLLPKENEVRISSNFHIRFFTERHKQYSAGNVFALTQLLFTYKTSYKKLLSALRCRTTSSQLVLSDKNLDFVTQAGLSTKDQNFLRKKADCSKIVLSLSS